jgi:cell volume regulation protein A
MFEGLYLVTLAGTAMVLAAAFSSLIAFRFGAPLLLLFLGIGLAAGQDGLGIPFDNAAAAYFVGSIALAIILFDSGFGTPLSSFRQASLPALSLATVGVILTAGLLGSFAFFLTNFDWLESLLLGSIVASTDAAAVFFLLRAGNLHIRERVRNTLEIESGSNDPIAIFLTLAFVQMISAGEALEAGELVVQVALGFLREMGIGIVAGMAGGRLIVLLVDRLKLDPGLLPIFVITVALVLFGLTGTIHGSGFVAVYVAGLVAGNSGMRSTATLKRFQDGISWLAQIIMFLVLGLFATPSQFLTILPDALALSLLLIFVARPVAISICLLPFRFARSETAFISWVGLRGAVSILLAIVPLLGGLDNAIVFFNSAFIIVLVSLLLQGWTINPLAKRLGLVVPPRIGPVDKVELELPGTANHELLAYRVVPNSPVAKGERIPRWARPSLVVRDGQSMRFQYAGRLRANDYVYLFISPRYPRLLDRLFASPAPVAGDDAEFFGAFAIDPSRPASELAAAYGPALRDGEEDMTIAQLMANRLGGRAEFADRVTFGPIELIVRDTDDDGAISSVGVSLEPETSQPQIPVFLSASEMLRLATRWMRRKPVEPQPTDGENVKGPLDSTQG